MADSLVYKLQNIKEDRNTNLKPENLKAGVTCLGIEGTLEPNTGSDVEPIYVTSNYTVKTIPVDLNETIDSISTYEDYVAVHTTLNKLKVYNKSDLSTPFITKNNVIPYNQGCYYIYGFEDNKLYITNGFNGSSTQDYYRIDLSKTTITHATYTDSNRLRNSGDLNINMTNNIVHFKHGSYLSIYSYDLTTGFTELSDEYNAVNSYIGNNVYEDLESIVIIQSNGSKTKHRVIPSGGEGAICGVNFTKTKAFLFMSGSNIIVYSLNDDYSMNEMLSTVSLPITFDDGIPKLQCLNSNYYYLSYKDNNYILNFDEETNQFSIVLTNENLIVRNSLPYIENENQYIDFEQGNVEIGITYNNKQYLTRDKYSGYTNTTLLSGHTMYDIAHQIVAGTMANNGDVVITPTTQEQTKEQGYYNSLKVSAVTSAIDLNIVPENIKSGVSVLGVEGTLNGGIDTSDADATSDDIVSPKTAYVNGERIEGTMKLINVQDPNAYYGIGDESTVFMDNNSITFYDRISVRHCYEQNSFVGVGMSFDEFNGQVGITPEKIVEGNTLFGVNGTATELKGQTKSITPTTKLQTIIPDENYNGITSVEVSAVTSAIDENIKAENIKSGVEILGVIGTLELGTGVDTSDADATADDIVSPKTAYVNGEKITGTINADSTEFGDVCDNVTINPNGVLNFSKTKDDGKAPILWTNGRTFSVTIKDTDLANTISLTADKIKKGETILGITGTYEGTMST